MYTQIFIISSLSVLCMSVYIGTYVYAYTHKNMCIHMHIYILAKYEFIPMSLTLIQYHMDYSNIPFMFICNLTI